jgi:hypothetical protein
MHVNAMIRVIDGRRYYETNCGGGGGAGNATDCSSTITFALRFCNDDDGRLLASEKSR